MTDTSAQNLARLAHLLTTDYPPWRATCEEAAEVIEALAAENAALRAERDAISQMSDGRLACIERIEAERDAWIAAIAPLDEVVALLGIQDDESLTPAEAVCHIMSERDAAQAEARRLREALDDANTSILAFGGPYAVQYARDLKLPPNHLHPVHYDILAKAGARMDGFTRAALEARPHD